jgi:serine/threonine-protein kinase
MVRRFVTEARAANSIPSPHVVRVTDFGQLEDGREYAVMEYLEGRSLGSILDAEGRLATPRAVELLRQTALGMAVAHEHGIIHRDLKPENLFVQQHAQHGEFVRILDFGVAKLMSALSRDAKVTAAGAFVGTPLYSAPEQAAGRPVGPACDVYALGAVAFELLTGKPLFDGDCMEVLVQKARGCDEALRTLPADLPPALSALISEMLETRPAARPGSMADVAERLGAIASTLAQAEPASASVEPSAPVVPASSRRARGRVAPAPVLAIVALIAVAAAVVWSVLPESAAKDRGAAVHEVTNSTAAAAGTASPPVPASRANTPSVTAAPSVPATTVQASAEQNVAPSAETRAGESAGGRARGSAEERAGAEAVKGGRAAARARATTRGRADDGAPRGARTTGSTKEKLGTLVDPFTQ